uniref:Uncharacterized protein n=1 Tax=Marophrys sp. SRT127 TaxID=2488311 RepID=A0A455RGM2_9EUKA|nr:hypothetical protein [Marophrys sp. SRT127]
MCTSRGSYVSGAPSSSQRIPFKENKTNYLLPSLIFALRIGEPQLLQTLCSVSGTECMCHLGNAPRDKMTRHGSPAARRQPLVRGGAQQIVVTTTMLTRIVARYPLHNPTVRFSAIPFGRAFS